jgi:adenylylsulfate kinase-like enzyme
VNSPAAPQPGASLQASRTVIVITGIQAAGKSTIAQLLAERLPQ